MGTWPCSGLLTDLQEASVHECPVIGCGGLYAGFCALQVHLHAAHSDPAAAPNVRCTLRRVQFFSESASRQLAGPQVR